MKWYQGDIATAILDCKATGAVLLVYIKGTEDSSQQMDQVWEDVDITKLFDTTHCISLQLAQNSVGGRQFSTIYPVTQLPSTYFITADGKVALVINGACSKDELQQKAEQVLHQGNSSGAQATPSAQSTPTVAGAQAMDNPETTEETEDEINANASYSSEERQAKIERARELIQLKQEKKAAEEKEKEKAAEKERRQLGKDMNKLKQYKAEQEAKETRDAIRKEKEETRLAREKVREQIKRDREARNAKYQQEKAEKEEALRKKQQEKLEQQAEEAARIAIINSSNARIQFRLPNGSRINHTFEADEPLQSAVNVLVSEPANPLGRAFRLATIYPRRVFTAEDYSSSFRDLSLVPTSALMVLPPSSGGDVARPPSTLTSSITSLLSLLFSPLLVLWGMVQAFLFNRPQRPSPPAQQSQQPADKPNSPAHGGTSTTSTDSTRPRRRVGRLADLSPGDDEQNTWNGNSTQQM